MGGCRCVYRKCSNSTTNTTGVHYFHFPYRDAARCELWIKNAKKPELGKLDKDKLRNKVICSDHFEEKCFTNEKHDRLVHTAVPTLGFEEDVDDSFTLQSKKDISAEEDTNIILIPIDEDHTQFTLPNVEFSGTCYTIFDDTVIPTAKIEEAILNEIQMNSATNPQNLQVTNVVNKIKKKLPDLDKSAQYFQDEPIVKKTMLHIPKNSQGDSQAKADNPVNLIISVPNSGSTTENSVSKYDCTNTKTTSFEKNKKPIVSPYLPVPENLETIEIEEVSSESYLPKVSTDSQQHKEENIKNKEVEIEDYVQMIKNNSKQIKNLKRLIHKQSKINRFLMLKKRKFCSRQRKLSKIDLLEELKKYVKPSLMAILKLELLSMDEVVLTDPEESFVTDLYTKNPATYNVLKNKFKWKLPSTDDIN